MITNETSGTYRLFRSKFTYLSFFLSIFVIMIHTFNLEAYRINGGGLYYFESIVNSFANFAVPTFFMLSGYQFYRKLGRGEIKRKLKSRFSSIFVPFVLWGIIEYLFFGLLKTLPVIGAQMNDTGKAFDLSSLADILIFGESHLWFLRNLILYHLLSLLFYRLLKNKYLSPVVVICFIVLPIIIPALDVPRGIVKNFSFYLFGAALSCHCEKQFESSFGKMTAVISGIGTVILAVLLMFARNSLLSAVVRLLCTVLIWVAASAFPIEKEAKGFIRQSFYIYVSHILVLECVEKIIFIAFKETLLGAWIDYLLAPIITVGILYIGYLLLHRFEKVWKTLTGARN